MQAMKAFFGRPRVRQYIRVGGSNPTAFRTRTGNVHLLREKYHSAAHKLGWWPVGRGMRDSVAAWGMNQSARERLRQKYERVLRPFRRTH